MCQVLDLKMRRVRTWGNCRGLKINRFMSKVTLQLLVIAAIVFFDLQKITKQVVRAIRPMEISVKETLLHFRCQKRSFSISQRSIKCGFPSLKVLTSWKKTA